MEKTKEVLMGTKGRINKLVQVTRVSFFLLGICLLVSVGRLHAGEYDRFLSEEAKGAEFVGSETCAACHEEAAREFKLSAHARIDVEEGLEGAQGCEMCHGPGSVHADNGGGRGTMINPRKKPEVCFTCHLDKKAEFQLPYRHPVLEGKMACADCHSSHGSDVRPWTSTSLEGVNATCAKCHKEQRGPFVFEHEALREGCTNCHKVHGSIHDKMLIVRDSNLCFRCHTQADFTASSSSRPIGNSDHDGRLYKGTCFSGGCHTAVHGSNFDDHLRY